MKLLIQNNKIIFIIFLICCCCTYWIYSFGFSGAFYFDDFRPLGNLTKVHDLASALYYINNETSGPLGRPISMLSFLLNLGDWPNHPENFFRINTVIHIFNGLIVYFISFKLFKILKLNFNYHALLALFVSFFWLILPLNVSTTLIAIQRMASISGTFVFLGVLAYLYALDYQKNNYKLGSLVLYASIGLFTLLAMFSKENGILLPLFLLIIEVTLLSKIIDYQQGKKLRLLLLGLCYLMVLVYLSKLLPNVEVIYASRPYTFEQRISTQPQILLDYFRLIFVPDIFSYNPFHDNYKPNTSIFDSSYSLFCAAFWSMAIISAILLRKKYVVYSFAILWFLTAHLLESTIIPLELYYEHRNYVATFAICFAVVYGISTIHGKKSEIFMYLLLLGYLIGLTNCTYLTTKTWGDRYYAAYAWQYNQEGSSRATEHLALMLLEDGNRPDALMYVTENTKKCHDCLNSYIQKMLIACDMKLQRETLSAKNYLLDYAKPLRSVAGLPDTLSSVFNAIQEKKCDLVSINDLKTLNQKFLNSPPSGSNIGNHLGLYLNLYYISVNENNINEQEKYIDNMWKLSQEAWIAQMKLRSLKQNNDQKDLFEFSGELCRKAEKDEQELTQICLNSLQYLKDDKSNEL